MKKIICVSVLTLSLLLSSCGSATTEPKEDVTPENSEAIVISTTDNSKETEETEETTEEEHVVIDTSWYEDDNSVITNGVYLADRDIATGNYIFNIINTAWSTRITIFETKEKYLDYHESNRFTNGEESDAIEANALINEYQYAGDSYAVNLKVGNVLMIKNGYGTLSLANGESPEPSSALTGANPVTLVSGVYLPGYINSDSYMLTCTQSDWGMTAAIFENREAYDAYMASKRFTVGEENKAREKNAWSDFYIDQGGTVYINLTDENVLMISGGSGQLVPVYMSWSK